MRVSDFIVRNGGINPLSFYVDVNELCGYYIGRTVHPPIPPSPHPPIPPFHTVGYPTRNRFNSHS
jgi:hypothetical protein